MSAFEFLITRRWWQWPNKPSAFDFAYSGMNLVEGLVWLFIAALVLRRYRLHRRSWLEPLYAATFAVFGLTDFIEMRMLSSWLIGLKGLVLAALLILRYVVIRKFYPASKTY